MYLLYQLPLLNSLIMPIAFAATASRLADAEHKGQTLRLLHTLQTPASLFRSKLFCGCGYLLAACLLQTAMLLALGLFFGFGSAPWPQIGLFFAANLACGLAVYLLQQIVSLLFINQAAGLILGLAGAFLGLSALFFPPAVQRLVPWAYYGLLATIEMDWNPASRETSFYFAAFDWGALIPLAIFCMMLYCIGKHIYLRKEL